MMNVLVGHEVGGSEGARTYTHRTPDDFREALETIRYPGLKLPRVYNAPTAVKARTVRSKRTA
jgi:hypothetical protein